MIWFKKKLYRNKVNIRFEMFVCMFGMRNIIIITIKLL